MVLIYVDDIIVIGNNNAELQEFIGRLNKVFSLKDLGDLHYFLGIEMFRDSTGIYLNQEKCISEMLYNLNMQSLKLVPAYMVAGRPLSVDDGEKLENPTFYRSIIGRL